METLDNKQNSSKSRSEENNDDFSWGGCIMTIVVIVAASWALIHYNPSEKKHREAIAEVLTESMLDGYSLTPSSAKAITNIKYHSIGVLSWTSTKYRGKTRLATVGALGYVYPLFE